MSITPLLSLSSGGQGPPTPFWKQKAQVEAEYSCMLPCPELHLWAKQELYSGTSGCTVQVILTDKQDVLRLLHENVKANSAANTPRYGP